MRKLVITAAVLVVLALTCVAPASAQYIDYYGQMSYSNRYPLALPGNPAYPYAYYSTPYAFPTYGTYYYGPQFGFNYGYRPYYGPRYYYPYSYGYSVYQPAGGIYYYRTY